MLYPYLGCPKGRSSILEFAPLSDGHSTPPHPPQPDRQGRLPLIALRRVEDAKAGKGAELQRLLEYAIDRDLGKAVQTQRLEANDHVQPQIVMFGDLRDSKDRQPPALPE